MKAKLRSVSLVVLLTLSTIAFAQSPRARLQQLTTQLLTSPNDDLLRESIIKLAVTLDPKPSSPDEVILAEGAGEYAFKNAQNNADYSDSAKEYEKALLIAPWIATDYFNCAVAHEKAGETRDAIRNFHFYILAAPNADDLQQVRKRIGGLQYAVRKAEDEASRPAKEAAVREAAAKEADERAGFTDNQNGTVSDHKMKLMWQRDDDSFKRNWADSEVYCRGLLLGGHSDWRLPTKEEWVSFWNEVGSKVDIRKSYFPSARGFYYWSSWASPEDGPTYAGRFFGDDGSVESGRKTFTYYVRCVRNYP